MFFLEIWPGKLSGRLARKIGPENRPGKSAWKIGQFFGPASFGQMLHERVWEGRHVIEALG